MIPSIAISIVMRGMFFKKRAKPLRKALKRAVSDLVEMGEQRLDDVLKPRTRPPGVYLSVAQAQRGKASTGHYRRSIHGETKGLKGRIDDSRVVYGPWLEGISSRNKTTRFKGYASFRKTTDLLNKKAKGVLQKRINAAVRELA